MHQDRELVAADLSKHIVWAQQVCPRASDLDEQRMSPGMPLYVIDGLEAVDFDQSDAYRLAVAPRARQTTIKFGLPVASVGETRERAGVGKIIELGENPVPCALLLADASKRDWTVVPTIAEGATNRIPPRHAATSRRVWSRIS